jgi:hypothetical protein
MPEIEMVELGSTGAEGRMVIVMVHKSLARSEEK